MLAVPGSGDCVGRYKKVTTRNNPYPKQKRNMQKDLAVVNYAPEPYSVELLEIPLATIADDQVLLEVESVGVCGSDLHMWTAQQSWTVNYPVVLGHEFCGTI